MSEHESMPLLRCRNNSDPLVVVDDSDDDLYIIRRFHKRSRLNNSLLQFNKGSEFLEYMERVRAGQEPMPAMVLLDINMPSIDGFAVLEKVRSHEEFAEIPIVVMLSNSDNPKDKQRAKELGANGYQTKSAIVDDYLTFLESLAPD